MVNSVDPQLAEVVEAASRLLPNGMSPWQARWCTPETISLYLNGRKGDVAQAAEILAQALRWREEYEEVLTGAVIPAWQGDLRVLSRSESGNPIVYGCAKNMPIGGNSVDVVNHASIVLEAAVRLRTGSALGFDVVADMHGFTLRSFSNPRPIADLMRMLQQGFRDRLRTCVIVDAPAAFALTWRLVAPMLKEKTREKIRFMGHAEAVEHLHSVAGAAAAETVSQYMAAMRSGKTPPVQRPSEVPGFRTEVEELSSMSGKICDGDREGWSWRRAFEAKKHQMAQARLMSIFNDEESMANHEPQQRALRGEIVQRKGKPHSDAPWYACCARAV